MVKQVINYPAQQQANLQEIMRSWFGAAPPDDYLVIDTETTGFGFTKAVILEVGWLLVRGQRVIDNGNVILNWFSHPLVDWGYICSSCANLREMYAKRGETHHLPPERIRAEGVSPVDALDGFYQLLTDTLARGELIVGHNAWYFDCPMINGNLHRFCSGLQIPWPAHKVFDTGLTEKASQLNVLPWPEDRGDAWFRRANTPANANWRLAHCVQKYQLTDRYPVDPRFAHTAAADCFTTYSLFETYRAIGQGTYRIPGA